MNAKPDLNQLFQTAQQEGTLSMQAAQTLDINDIGAQIQAGLGTPVDQVQASEVVLVTQMPDDSGSIRMGQNSQVVRDGHNQVLDALNASKQKDGILAHTRYLNGTVLFPYCPLNQAVRMDSKNYNPNLGTPLYDQTLVLLATVLAKAQLFADNGVPARAVTLLITDGADAGSGRSARDVKKIVNDLLKTEQHIIAALGIDDGSTDFKQVFREMGIRDEWILLPGNSPSEIRKAFQVFSQSAARASQSAGHFSKMAASGFFN
jgi:hypothetical protein